MSSQVRARVLCIHGNPEIRHDLVRVLNGDYDAKAAATAAQALANLDQMGGAAVIITATHVAGVDGVSLLCRVRDEWPLATRIALTEEDSVQLLARAVNEAGVFRYLFHPCSPSVLLRAVADGVDRFEKRAAENRALDETLNGAVNALCDVLSIVNPVAYGRSIRVRRYVAILAQLVGVRVDRELQVAAALSEVGYLFAPPEAVARIYGGVALQPNDTLMEAIAPSIGRRLLRHMPLMYGPSSIIEAAGWPVERRAQLGTARAQAAGILSVALGFDEGLRKYGDPQAAIERMQADPQRFDAAIVALLATRYGAPNLEAIGD